MLLEGLYNQYYQKLLTIALGEFRDLDVAEDFVQRTFLSALHYGYNPERGANPYTWLVNLLKWEIQTYYKEKAELHTPPEQYVPLDEVGEAIGVHSHLTLERMVDAALCLKRLPPSLQGVAMKYFLEGWTAEEIAEDAGVSHRTVKRMITRVYNRFREDGLKGDRNADARKDDILVGTA